MSNFHNAVMNIPVSVTMSETGLKADMMLYQWGIRMLDMLLLK